MSSFHALAPCGHLRHGRRATTLARNRRRFTRGHPPGRSRPTPCRARRPAPHLFRHGQPERHQRPQQLPSRAQATRSSIEVFGEDDLRTNARLNSDGALSLPLLGAVKLAGLTLNEAASRLTELYGRDYLVSPKVNVTLVGYAKRRFTILGQVNRPGSFEMPDGSPNGIDLLEAIAIAGGYTRIAAPERISVRRKSEGGDKVLRVNAKRLAKGQGANAGGFRVEPGDTITVGESIF